MQSTEVLLSLGSNIGDRIENIKRAIDLLVTNKIVENITVSSFYETEPVGYKNQPYFINAAIRGRTSLSPYKLLSACKEIEQSIGRKPRPKWHEREIDLDIILYGSNVVATEDLRIPHPQIHQRLFVLIPANEIASQWLVPQFNKTIGEMLQECKDQSSVDLANEI
ncbi:MAG: 2-amino-4-hydroxy-6-hydroxymethyldihydropteridine diphosphokinase [Candidatus Kapaibacteriota bacterium]|jgi:2-amino-4-hydroxy-6-hydroxymethyldihydropteridine diphosphokinase